MALTAQKNADLTKVGAGARGDPIGTIRDAAENRMVEIIPGEFNID